MVFWWVLPFELWAKILQNPHHISRKCSHNKAYFSHLYVCLYFILTKYMAPHNTHPYVFSQMILLLILAGMYLVKQQMGCGVLEILQILLKRNYLKQITEGYAIPLDTPLVLVQKIKQNYRFLLFYTNERLMCEHLRKLISWCTIIGL